VLAFFFSHPVFADELEDIAKKITEVQRLLEESKKASKPLEENLQKVENDIRSIENSIYGIEQGITDKEKEIKIEEKELDSRRAVLDVRVRQYYKHSRSYVGNSIGVFLGNNLPNALRKFFIQQKSIQTDRDGILKVAFLIVNLEEKKLALEDEKTKLTALKASLDKEKAFFAAEVAKAQGEQRNLQSEIASLTALQQQIIAQKQASLGIPRSSVGSELYCTDDRKTNPGFGNAFAFFTFGIPHYVGLNQYGAYGRAKDNQDYKTILNAYFQNISIECRDLPSEIEIEGFGKRPFEEYTKGVVNKEMGADLPEALKAQAIAARSFAIVESNNASRAICASQSCQVYADDRREAVNSAVDATGINACGDGKGEVVISNGEVVKTWFASTFGGYSHTSAEIWGGSNSYTKNLADVRSPVNSFADLFNQAYDKESACFYTAQGWRDEYSKSAWLKSEEVADIVNTLMLLKKDSGTTDNLYQLDKPNPRGQENWNAEKVKSKLRENGITPYNSISGVTVNADFTRGVTTRVYISGDAGDNDFDGGEFQGRFNLRAPANIQIVGPLYNVEHL